MEVTIPKPWDMHVHCREGEMLRAIAPRIVQWCTGAVAMPNTPIPIETASEANLYSQAIRNAGGRQEFTVLPTIMMPRVVSDKTIKLVLGLKQAGVFGIKVYIAGTTTNSSHGVKDLETVYPLIEAAKIAQVPVLFHGELAVDGNRELAFLPEFEKMVSTCPHGPLVLEHLSTWQAVELIKGMPDNIGCTITPHHLLEHGVDPSDVFLHCLPVIKTVRDCEALRAYATSGDPKVMLGSDIAPHTKEIKRERRAGGICCLPRTYICLLYDLFEQASVLDNFVAFTSGNAVQFHGLSQPSENLVIMDVEWRASLEYAGVRLFRGGQLLKYQVFEEQIWCECTPPT